VGLILWMSKFTISFTCAKVAKCSQITFVGPWSSQKIGFVFRSFRILMHNTTDVFGWETLRCVPLIKIRLVLSFVTKFIAASIYHSESQSLHSLSILENYELKYQNQ
jgi:hypothetical protein